MSDEEKSSALRPLGETAAELVADLLGPSTKALGQVAGEWLGAWRLERLAKLRERISVLRGHMPDEALRTIPPGLATGILEAASLEDTDEIMELWARLIAGSQDPKSDVKIHKAFIAALKGMEPNDAIVLEHMGDQGWLEFAEVPGGGITPDSIAGNTGLDRSEAGLAIGNLLRLGCVETNFKLEQNSRFNFGQGNSRVQTTNTYYRLTSLGRQLLAACRSNQDAKQ